MKQKMLRTLPLFAFGALLVLAIAQPAFAQTEEQLQNLRLSIFFTNDASGIYGLLSRILSFLLFIAGLVTFFFVLYGGFAYLTSGGDAAKAAVGQKIIVNAVIGIIIIFISYALVRFLVTAIPGGGNTFLPLLQSVNIG